jgi:hypothetical protein
MLYGVYQHLFYSHHSLSTQLVAERIMLPMTFRCLNFSFLCLSACIVYCVHFMYVFVVSSFTVPLLLVSIT